MLASASDRQGGVVPDENLAVNASCGCHWEN